MSRVVILQSNYLPWKGYFDLIGNADIFAFYDTVQFTKNDWRNRNKIYAKGGVHWLTIPVPKNAVKLNIDEVRPTDQSWRKKHLKSITQTYSRAPHFDQLRPLLQELYEGPPMERLVDINRVAIRAISAMAGFETRFVVASDLELRGARIGRLLHILEQLGATEYLSGPAAQSYLEGSEGDFEAQGIKLSFKRYEGYPTYEQRGKEFRHDVSIIDVLAHVPLESLPKFILTSGRDLA